MKLREYQAMIERIYGKRDRERGFPATFQWFIEEVGELAQAQRKGSRAALEEEFADCLAWLTTLASICEVDLQMVSDAKYPGRCSYCEAVPCECGHPEVKE